MNRTIGIAPFLSLIVLLAACSQPRSGNQEGTTSTSSRAATPAPAVMSEEGVVYTANERGNSISAIDVSTGHVRNIATPLTPHNVQVSRDGRLLLAVGPAADMTGNQSPMKMTDGGKMVRGRLLILDAETLAVESAVNIDFASSLRGASIPARASWMCSRAAP